MSGIGFCSRIGLVACLLVGFSCNRVLIKPQSAKTSQVPPDSQVSQDSQVQHDDGASPDSLTPKGPTEPKDAPASQDDLGTPTLSPPQASPALALQSGQSLPPADQPQDKFPFLKAPSLDGWSTKPLWPQAEAHASALAEYPLVAVAVYNHAPVYDFPNQKLAMVGRVRYGTTLRAKPAVKKPGCSRGRWHEIKGGAFVCSADGFRLGEKAPEVADRVTMPAISQVEPFLSGKVESGTPRFFRIPTLAEEQALATLTEKQAVALEYVDKFLHGIYFIGIVDELEDQQRVFYRTSMGNYVRKEKVKVLEPSGMHGELLQSKADLPVAFVFGETRQVWQLREGSLHSLGTIEKHARFRVAGSYRDQDREYVIGPQQIAVLREQVRVATWQAKPDGIPENAKWLHLNLAQQTFVAYEGSRPVLVSLLSSGIKGRDTPTGLYQINRKYITKTMSGVDDEEGWYEVGEVPWTFYYRGNYAVHGAYWHNVFGETRSHGCTNIPPADARWLFAWFEPQLPKGWHAQFHKDDGWTLFTETKVEIEPYQPSPNQSEDLM